MTRLELEASISEVDGQTVHLYKANDSSEILNFLARYDHEGSSVSLKVVGHNLDAYQLLWDLEKLRNETIKS